MDIFAIVADPTRRAMIELLAERDRTAGDLVKAFPKLTQPAVSKHLKSLLDFGLVKVRPLARQRVYALTPHRLDELGAWLNRFKRVPNEPLVAPERQALEPPQPMQPLVRLVRRRID
jgi:DNA-binding transcriptional ArsR family regulator